MAPRRPLPMARIDAQTRLVLLLGYPVAHSQSPLIHNAAFQRQGVNAVYVAAAVRPAALADAVAGLKALDGLGANVTIPHKQAVLPLMDTLSPRATAVGAVNTIVCRPAADHTVHLYGDNTDVPGFLAPLRPWADRLAGAPMVILGAGGAARAVAYALLTTYRPARLTLAARTLPQAEALVRDLAPYDAGGALAACPLAEAHTAVRRSTLLVNATPVGMHPAIDQTPWPDAGAFRNGQVVYDLIYNPARTRLMDEAAAQGATVLGGLGMLIEQAAAAYVQWTARPMPTRYIASLLTPKS